jgi:hypothetical protein
MTPLEISSSVIRMRSTVDLPEPEGPMMVTFSPGYTSKSSSSSTIWVPYFFTTFSNLMIGSVI